MAYRIQEEDRLSLLASPHQDSLRAKQALFPYKEGLMPKSGLSSAYLEISQILQRRACKAGQRHAQYENQERFAVVRLILEGSKI